ncbi:hypothetical protein A0256_02850 [Mucilaginibacter sp. PAMC 26640]|nr:hypothetical protein A0256_02850 [Mucilaginibacter sp. PAMC 26640]
MAQDAKGTLYRKISNDRLANVVVTNLNNRAIAMTDIYGNFSIKAALNDTLQFTTNDYTPQKQMYTGYSMIVYMQPQIKLGEVTVRGQTKKQELSEIMQAYRSKGLYYDGKPPVTVFLPIGGSPLTGLRELFSKDAKNLRRFAKFQKNELEASEVDRRYNKLVVMRVTGAKDTTEVLKFMDFWRPSYEDLKVWGDYDLIKQIKAKFEYYRKEGDRVSLPNLY